MKKTVLLFLSLFPFVSALAQLPNFVWARQLGASGPDLGSSVAVDIAGNVYTTGTFEGTVDFDPGPGTYLMSSAGSDDAFISKLDASGNFVWAISLGSVNLDRTWGITLDGGGNIFTTGTFQGTVDFDPGPSSYTMNSGTGGRFTAFVLKLDPSANLIWAKQLGYGGYAEGRAIGVDPGDNVIITGYCNGTCDFDPDPTTYNLISASSDIFISKLNSSGNLIWAHIFGGANVDQGTSLYVDAASNIYTSGFFNDTADFDPGPAVFNLNSTGLYTDDIFISKLDRSGNFVFAKAIVGPGTEISNGITLDGAGNIYTCGRFANGADMDPGPGTYTMAAKGIADAYVSKFDTLGNFIWARQFQGNSTEGASNMKTDLAGNIYVTGYFSDTCDFDPGIGTYTLIAAGSSDLFITKLNAAGNFNWAMRAGSSGTTTSMGCDGNAIFTDVAGAIYTTGYFVNTCDFDPGAGVYNMSSAGATDAFILKLSQGATPVNEINSSFSFGVFPNPTSGACDVILKKSNGLPCSARLYNAIGQLISEKNNMTGPAFSIDLTEQCSGMYFLELTTAEKAERVKIIKD
ncbi:MAG: SBBP repeat-containing protein [Bacteroidia bacterium]